MAAQPGARWRRRPRGLGLVTACLVGAVASGTLACQPTPARGMTAVGVALATDQVSTRALEEHGVEVRWLTCEAELRKVSGTALPRRPATAATDNGVARVRCTGRSAQGDLLRVSGQVTDERRGTCVRGRLRAQVADQPLFTARVLGDCGRGPTTGAPSGRPGPTDGGARPTVTTTVTPSETVPTAPVTVTVTASPEPRPTVTETVTPSAPVSESPTDPPAESPTEPPAGGPGQDGPAPTPEPTRGESGDGASPTPGPSGTPPVTR